MKTYVLAAALMAASFTALAGNDHSNPCGNNGNNCDTGGGNATANGGSANAGAAAIAGAAAGAISGSHSSVGDVTNVAAGGDGGSAISISEGGKGGSGGSSIATGGVGQGGNGGDAQQGQKQRQSNTNAVNASSRNANQSSAAGNTTVTNVGGDSTLVERNAPPVFLGALTPTSCGGGFNAGGSSRDGAGAFGIQWVGKECRIRMVGDRYHALGMVDTACEVYKTTKGFRDAAKRNPKLRDLDCTVKPAAVVAPAEPVIPQEFLEARIPRG